LKTHIAEIARLAWITWTASLYPDFSPLARDREESDLRLWKLKQEKPVVAQAIPPQGDYPKRNNSNTTTKLWIRKRQTVNTNNQSAQVFWKQTRWNLSNVKNQEIIFKSFEYIKAIIVDYYYLTSYWRNQPPDSQIILWSRWK
jgi:hypothetical protein